MRARHSSVRVAPLRPAQHPPDLLAREAVRGQQKPGPGVCRKVGQCAAQVRVPLTPDRILFRTIDVVAQREHGLEAIGDRGGVPGW